MSYLILKIIALISMTFDHLWFRGIFSNGVFTCIGRLAFPIFCYQLVEGFEKTSDLKKYKLRLLLFALISEIPFDLFCYNQMFSMNGSNVMFTLLLGLLCIESLRDIKNHKKSSLSHYFTIFICFLLANALNTDYSYWGLITIILFYGFKSHDLKYLIYIIWFIIFAYLNPQIVTVELFNNFYRVNRVIFTMFSVFLLWFIESFDYFKNRVYINKYLKILFYMYYPLHMLLIYFLSQFGGI